MQRQFSKKKVLRHFSEQMNNKFYVLKYCFAILIYLVPLLFFWTTFPDSFIICESNKVSGGYRGRGKVHVVFTALFISEISHLIV